MNHEDRPLVSLVVFAYKQEKYIREAVQSALAQDYSPLEVVLSDDASPDSTFEIMKSIARYYDGPHSIKLNRNDVNLGIGGHLNKISSLVSSEFIIIQAGDDMSVNHRVSRVVDEWLASGKKAHYIHSDVMAMDQFGVRSEVRRPVLGHKLNNMLAMVRGNPHGIGASEAFSIELFRRFGPLDKNIIHEDCVLPFRSALIGRCYYINEPLVYYRDGGISATYQNNDSLVAIFEKEAVVAQRYVDDFKQKLRDFLTVSANREVEKALRRKIAEWQLVARMSAAQRVDIRAVIGFLRTGNRLDFAIKQTFKFSFPRLYFMFFNKRGKFHAWIRR